jgi:hypothetical protein
MGELSAQMKVNCQRHIRGQRLILSAVEQA